MSDGKVPVQVTDLTGAAAIATGDSHSCARLTSGGLACWGANNVGQLGSEGAASVNTPIMVQGLNVTAIAPSAHYVRDRQHAGAPVLGRQRRRPAR